MAYRTFVDRRNSYWQAWDVRPERIERRSVERRQHSSGEWKGVERRVGDRRRLDQKRVVLDNGLGTGWLVFESKSEKRRLTPIPKHWEISTESQLRLLCEKAQLVPGNGSGTYGTSAA
ncbi:MAG: hypothetical protein H0W63_00690 [Gemmatimonadaceae bacterium]|nr:hypothetical protein [Gemmatimonadaceae bacterium]